MKEFDLIYKYFATLIAKNESLNLLDDCAVVSTFNNEKIIVNVDTIVENKHFFSYNSKKSSAKSIANKLLGVNLSDLASMGAIPKYWTMAISLPSEYYNDIYWIEEFVKELKKIQKKYNFYLIGGDTTSSDVLVLTANLFGMPSNNKILKQKNAKENDIICVSNTIGDSYWGLQVLNNNKDIQFLSKQDKNYLINRYNYINPQVKLGCILVDFANSATDISDGLLKDLEKIAINSNLLADIDVSLIPISLPVKKIHKKINNSFLESISGGDDYELIFSITKNNLMKLKKYLVENKLSKKIHITEIGIFKKKLNNVNLIVKHNNKIINDIVKKGFVHS